MKSVALSLLAALGACEGCAHAVPTQEVEAHAVADRVLNATVYVDTPRGHGSGFAVTPDTIITAAHVAAFGVDGIELRDGTTCEIQDVIVSTRYDVAAVRISGCEVPTLDIRRAPILEGASVHIAGNPQDLRWSISAGHVMDSDEGDLVVDAVALPGMSGGPVTDDRGRVVGMVVRIIPVADMLGSRAWGGESKAIPASTIAMFAFP